jgi:hypothetical protein
LNKSYQLENNITGGSSSNATETTTTIVDQWFFKSSHDTDGLQYNKGSSLTAENDSVIDFLNNQDQPPPTSNEMMVCIF